MFEATEPDGCDCDKVTVANVMESTPASSRMIHVESNRLFWGVAAGMLISSIFKDKPQDMSPL